MNSFQAVAQECVSQFQKKRPLRSGSLLISIFGDSIAPRGGAVWLGSLINALRPFGINQRLVRTSVYRLSKDRWIDSEQIGRRSYYHLTQEGQMRIDDASRRIYSERRQEWTDTWCLVLLNGVDATNRDYIRKELAWFGFAPFSPHVLAHPSPDLQSVEKRLEKLDNNDQILIMQATTIGKRSSYLHKLVHEAWSLQDLDDRYSEFLKRFRPVYKAAQSVSRLDPESSFQVRTLLIHEYRKILLRDPFLPAALLPNRWKGVSAYELCRNIYSLVAEPAEEFLTKAMENANGPLPRADPSFYQRFSGL